MNRKLSLIFSLLTIASIIAGCSMFGDDEKSSSSSGQVKRVESSAGGPDKGLLNTWFGLNEQPGSGGSSSGTGISVNGLLWRAALDTISFMPLAQADPFGGIILTDWYRPPETMGERFKVNVYILDSELRADGLRVSVFRQRREPNAGWVDAKVSADTGTNLENSILKRARQMRVNLQ
tara:strand:+ start:533 stop:1066 length:534 start_codon:yes stop_codon:yes gene_type:complete